MLSNNAQRLLDSAEDVVNRSGSLVESNQELTQLKKQLDRRIGVTFDNETIHQKTQFGQLFMPTSRRRQRNRAWHGRCI